MWLETGRPKCGHGGEKVPQLLKLLGASWKLFRVTPLPDILGHPWKWEGWRAWDTAHCWGYFQGLSTYPPTPKLPALGRWGFLLLTFIMMLLPKSIEAKAREVEEIFKFCTFPWSPKGREQAWPPHSLPLLMGKSLACLPKSGIWPLSVRTKSPSLSQLCVPNHLQLFLLMRKSS